MHARTSLPMALLVAAAISGGAYADVDAAIADPGLWFFDITHMPDIDQRRDELPNNGSMYCVPTATMNLMAYFATHGLSGLEPGIANWRADSLHGYMSFHLANLGTAMQTSSTGGTTGDDGHDGTVYWLSGYPGYFTVTSQYSTHTWSPQLSDAATQIILYGGYAVIGCGWYTGSTVVTRGGGHRMTLVSGASDWPDVECGVRDPAIADGDINKQSSYMTEQYVVDQQYVRPSWASDFRFMDEMIGRGSGSTRAIIDDYSVIKPTFALTSIPEINAVQYHSPWNPSGGTSVSGVHAAVADTTFCEGIFGPNGELLLKVIPSDDLAEHQLFLGRPVEDPNSWQQIDVGGVMLDFKDYAYGRHRAVYVYDGTLGLICYDIDQQAVTATAPPLPVPVDSITYVDGTDEILLLSVGFDQIIRYDRTLQTSSVQTIAPGASLEQGAQIEAYPPDEIKVLIWSPGAVELHHMTAPLGGGDVVLEHVWYLQDPADAVAVGDAGLVLASTGGAIAQYRVVNGDLLLDESGPFNGLPAGSSLTVSRSTTNYDPAIHAAEDYNVLVTTHSGEVLPDCVADFDYDGSVSTIDLLGLLAAWGTPDPYMDIAPNGGDETVSVSDLLMLLAAWGPCN